MILVSTMFYLAPAVSVFEQYSGNGSDGNDYDNLALCKAARVADDLQCRGDRESIRFFLKGVSCTCSKAKYSLSKKSQPIRMGECFNCKQPKEQSSLLLCRGRCKLPQYCCRECQAADWSEHKALCSKFTY